MKISSLFTLIPFITKISSQQNCPSGTPKATTIRGAWQHRWVFCENYVEGECPRDLPALYSNFSKDNCDNYYSESGDDFIIDYYFCENKSKFDYIQPDLEDKGWICDVSEE